MLVVNILLVLFFLFASSIKLLGWQKFIFETQLTFFKKYGLTRTHMFLVGLVELFASLLLMASIFLNDDVLQVFGALGIIFTSSGAIYSHLRFDTVKDVIPAIVTLSLSVMLLAFNSHVLALFA
ncbi:DoxX family protein [Thalassotalea sp. M1531]|uniref:DoxX family protein n=1 Tax=Thalassotalea algicola TaxID=2716224 RepID=A0A7Y0LAI7_9GAMM|nr:DoxX family protein [Thalassotalea algicola]NMP30866.1 DoxX family protein [Thalassotalea algicola]